MKLDTPCLVCEGPITVRWPSDIREETKYCSAKCTGVAKRKARLVGACQNSACDKEFRYRRPSEVGRKKFCSIQCAGAAKVAPPKEVSKRTKERIEDVKWIAGSDNPESIASRTGFGSVPTMLRILRRAGEHELARRIHNEYGRYAQVVDDDDQEAAI